MIPSWVKHFPLLPISYFAILLGDRQTIPVNAGCISSGAWIINFKRIDIPTSNKVKSLCWRGDSLVDWIQGPVEYRLDGSVIGLYADCSESFDSALSSPSGRFVAIYEKLGEKGMLLREGNPLRKLTRDEDHHEVFEWPITFTKLSSGREVLIHCPAEYGRLEIEDAETGECLTADINRKVEDFYHSRLAVSQDGRWLLSAGWGWHPCDEAYCFEIASALANPSHFDHAAFPKYIHPYEANSATFLDNDRLLRVTNLNDQSWNSDPDPPVSHSRLEIFNLSTGKQESVINLPVAFGTMMPVGSRHVVAFFKHPRLIAIDSGEVMAEWPDIATSRQYSSIIWGLDVQPPPMALDPVRHRFAVAQPGRISVVEFDLNEPSL